MRCLAVLIILAASSIASASAAESRIVKAVDNNNRVTLTGHVRPQAQPQNDIGRLAPSVPLTHVSLVLSQSQGQQKELNQLLLDQQNPSSPLYHHWLTPDEYGARFGASDADISTLTSWLQQQGLTVTGVAHGHNWISFDGSAAQVEAAFQTELHQYLVNGETHYANATEPSIPNAFQPVVQGVHGLTDFRPRPHQRKLLTPKYNDGSGDHFIAPNDFATIYNVSPLYSAGINGSGQKIAVMGQTEINLSDIETFRSQFGLAANDPQLLFVPNTQNPGVSQSDLPEADLDLEWSGAVARNASIIFVYTYNVEDSLQYAVDQNLAPVITTSYGLCEVENGSSDTLTQQSWAIQGNAQGISFFAASGDSGATDCGDPQNPGLAVDVPAAIPQFTGVGGTEFNEGSGNYWSSSNGSTGASVLSYIPEVAWNDSAQDGTPSASGGGSSIFFAKPSWQTGTGVPSDNARHVPDVALSASADHDGYVVYSGGQLQVYGGTSVPAPSFAGLTALLNQYVVSKGIQSGPGLGNINPTLYSLAQTAPSAFHDITIGNNIVTPDCPRRSLNCNSTPVGYNATVGYDPVTGLGSVNAYNLALAWTGNAVITPPTNPQNALALVASTNTISSNGTLYLTATVTSTDGATPTGSVIFTAGSTTLGSISLTGSGGSATATLGVPASSLPQGSSTVTAEYSGNSSVNATISVSVSSSASETKPTIGGLAHGASFKQAFAPGMILSVFGSQFAPTTESASTVPLPLTMAGVEATVNGIAAPLYYVSPGQLNIQVPYEVSAGSTAVVTVNNNGQLASQSIPITKTAPGIFVNPSNAPVPSTSGARGSIITLYVTGAGAVSPQVATGAGPSSSAVPVPAQALTVTVGGVPASVQYDGIPSGLVGVIQVNYEVPSGVAIGAQPVVVSVGGVQSPAATLTVTN